MPPFPGAQRTSVTWGDLRSAQTRACSRPPPPMTRTFIRSPAPLLRNLLCSFEASIVADEVKRLGLFHCDRDRLGERQAEQGQLGRAPDADLISAFEGQLFAEGEPD